VIVSMKQCYQADRLRNLADEDDNIIGLWKKISVECYIWRVLGTVLCESSNAGSILEVTSSRSSRR
jgi:hypothetical protein